MLLRLQFFAQSVSHEVNNFKDPRPADIFSNTTAHLTFKVHQRGEPTLSRINHSPLRLSLLGGPGH